MKLWDKISSLIADDKTAEGQQVRADAQEEQKPQQTQQPQQSPGDQAPVEMGLAGAALSPADANTVLSMLPKGQSLDQFSAGQIQLLNIESVRADLGDRWSKVEHQVHMVVEATLRRMLQESDIFTQISDSEYLVIFPNLTEQKASALMYVAAAQIRQKLFGHDSAFAAIRLNATVTRVTSDLMGHTANPVGAIHEATLLGQPAEPSERLPDEQPLMPPIAPWTDKYKIVPIEGGHMTQGRIVADPLRAGGPIPDFSGLPDKSQASAGLASGEASEVGWGAEQPAPVAGYPVVSLVGSGKSDRKLIKDTARPAARLPDFSAVHATPRARSSGIGSNEAGGQTSQADGEPVPEIQGYPVIPITGSGPKESYLVQGAARPQGRVPDFSSASAPSVVTAQSATAPAAARNVAPPALAARLDALATKAAPFKAIPIGRPVDAQAGTRGRSEAAAASDPGAQIAPVEIEELQLLYEPIWDVKRQAVTAYRMKITLRVEGALLGLNEFCLTYDDPNLQSMLNSVILRKLISQIQLTRRERKRAIIVAPIGRRFIDDQSGLRFLLDQVSMLNDQERQLVVLEIGDAYFGSWPTLTPRIAMLRRVCRNISVRLSLDHKDFQQVAATGASIVAGDLSDHDWPERQALTALNSFAAAASKATLRSFIGGLATSSTVIAAVCAGFNHLSGTAIGNGTAQPLGVYPLSTEGFYLQRQARRVQQDQGS
jgi:GGDEF domain-containing protein